MNRKNLDMLLKQYIDRFEELDDKDGNNEGYKWRVIDTFQKNWDIDADDFAEMFNKSIYDVQKTNLIDGNIVAPLNGIVKLLEKKENVESIRECFKTLFLDDNGDLENRLNRIDDFIYRINKMVDCYYPKSWKFIQDRKSVIWYLNLWRPQENYIFKASEVKKFAECIEYGDDFGSGSNFSLLKYYKMCDELLSVICSNEILMEKQSGSRNRKVENYNDKNHILVFDIMYCAAAKYYNFYAGMVINKVSAKERDKYSKVSNIKRDIDAKCEELSEMESCGYTFPNMVGMMVWHKKYGECIVEFSNNNEIQLRVDNEIKIFADPIRLVERGIVIVCDEEISERVQVISDLERRKEIVKLEIANLRVELSKLI